MTTSVNGDSPSSLPPEQASSPSSIKRKHDQISTEPITNGEDAANDAIPPIDVPSSVRSIWQVLNAQSYSSTLLSHIASFQPLSDQSQHADKRPKLSSSQNTHTIISNVDNDAYDSLASFVADVQNACVDLLKTTQASKPPINGSVNHWTLPAGTLEQEKLVANVSSLIKLVNSLVQREQQSPKTTKPMSESKPEQPSETQMNGIKHEHDASFISSFLQDNGRSVLTLLGNSQGHRQLFSSLQRPFSKSQTTEPYFDQRTDSVVPLRENGLPPGISSTTVVPVPKQDLLQPGKSQRSTLQDTFSTPVSVAAMAAPKTPKPISTRQPNSTWSQPSTSTQRRVFGYTSEKLATGAWLGYDGIAPPEELATPQAKRKQRDRALSIGEGSFSTSQSTKAAQSQAEEEALFRCAYSSFAPSVDNSSALVSEDTRNALWWHRYGNYFFQDAFTTEHRLDSSDFHVGDQQEAVVDEEQLYKEAAEQFVPAEISTPAAEQEDKDAESLLEEISHMLETLHSYQRIRLSSLSSGTHRSNLLQNSPLQNLTGDSNNPSEAEIETYKTLKDQLALLVSMLPPYAVAKLNGDQLEDLNISRDIPVQVQDYRGVMEEDKASRDANQAAFQAAVGMAATSNRQTPALTPTQARSHHVQQSARGLAPHQQYNSNTPRTMPRAQPQFSRQPLSSWQNPNLNYQMNTQRPAYANPQHLNQPASRNMLTPIQPGYGQTPASRPVGSHQLPNGSYQTPGMNYQNPQRPQNFGSPSKYLPNGNYAASNASPSKMMSQPQRNFSPQTNNQSPTMQMSASQQSHPASITQNQHHSIQSLQQQQQQQRQQQQYQHQQPQNAVQNPPQPAGQNSQQPQHGLGLANSPLPRPSSSGGVGSITGTGNTETAVESRSITPATSVAAATPAPPQADAPFGKPPVEQITTSGTQSKDVPTGPDNEAMQNKMQMDMESQKEPKPVGQEPQTA